MDSNGNTEVELLVKHLSPPSQVASDASIYVVWIRPHNENLVGKFNTTTPHRTFMLMVTPEPSARMSQPTHDAVFTTEVAMADK
jgi:hypothetical protein